MATKSDKPNPPRKLSSLRMVWHHASRYPLQLLIAAIALGIAAGAACMALERWTWRGAERITYARQVYPGDRYALVAHFRP